MSDYDWSRFDVWMYFDASPDAVYDAWATAAGMESFFIESMAYTAPDGRTRAPDERAEAGDAYAWRWHHGHELAGIVVAAEPPHRFAFSFGANTTVTAHVDAGAGRTALRLEQAGIPTDPEGRVVQHLNCRSCWIYFLTNLKAVLEHGIDVREHDRDTADCVSVHFAEQHAAP